MTKHFKFFMLAIFALATFGACQQEDIFISNTEGGVKF